MIFLTKNIDFQPAEPQFFDFLAKTMYFSQGWKKSMTFSKEKVRDFFLTFSDFFSLINKIKGNNIRFVEVNTNNQFINEQR